MPIEKTAAADVSPTFGRLDNPTVRQSLRLAIGTSLALAYAFFVNWTASFVAPIMVAALLTKPLPAPSARLAVTLLAKIFLCLLIGVGMLLPIHEWQLVGLCLAALLVFAASYAQARGSISSIDFALAMVAALMIPVIAANSIDAGIEVSKGIAKSALVVFPAVWIAFAILPERVIDKLPNAPALDRTSIGMALHALRPVIVVAPVFILLLAMEEGSKYAVVLMKAVTIAEQTTEERGTRLAKDMMLSTIIGSIGGVAVWWTLKIWPSLLWYTLLTALSALWFGSRIFKSGGLSPSSNMWGYAFMTTIILDTPSVLKVGLTGDTANTRFMYRLVMFLCVTMYGAAAVWIFDRMRKK